MTLVNYMGNMVDKNSFRVFVYGANGEKKLANSWEEYQELICSGVWFTTKESAESVVSDAKEEEVKQIPVIEEEVIEEEKPKRKNKKRDK
jgi:hypothetical protein